MTHARTDNRITAAAPCPCCLEPAHLVIDDTYFTRTYGPAGVTITGRVTEVRHATPNGSNNCAGIA